MRGPRIWAQDLMNLFDNSMNEAKVIDLKRVPKAVDLALEAVL